MRLFIAMLFFASIIFAQFEVASIKPAKPVDWSRPNAERPGIHIDGARFDARALPFAALVLFAYDLDFYQLVCPSWMDQTLFDVSATLPTGTDKRDVPAMVQSLLRERFQIALKKESRQFSVYDLVLEKSGPKMKPAPAGTEPDQHDMTNNVDADAEHMRFNRISIPDLARIVGHMAGRPVLDKTGLTGAWKVPLDVSLSELRGHAGVGPPGASSDAASDPGGVPSLFTSIEKLGLKLEAKKEPTDVLVIDHAERTPNEN